ncbi:hypothetical protein, partial [Plasmodium yoelii yoelii]
MNLSSNYKMINFEYSSTVQYIFVLICVFSTHKISIEAYYASTIF